MKRSAPLKRTRMSRVSAGQRAFLAAYTVLRREILERDRHRCRFCLARVPSLEIHHVVKRSANKALRLEPSNLLALCPYHHAMTDRPYRLGRLCITPRGDGKFEFVIKYASDKFEARALRRANELGAQR